MQANVIRNTCTANPWATLKAWVKTYAITSYLYVCIFNNAHAAPTSQLSFSEEVYYILFFTSCTRTLRHTHEKLQNKVKDIHSAPLKYEKVQ